MRPPQRSQRGFTLLEVVVAVAILGVSLTVLLQAQATSLANAGRSRDITVGTLLARGKMIDIEKHLFHDGFQMSTEDEDGDFHEEGYPEVKWHYRISEVELDISALTSICGGLGKKVGAKDEANGAASDCESLLGGVGSTLGAFFEEMGRSLRVIDLKVSWAEGKYAQTINVRALTSRDDFQTEQENDAAKTMNQLQGAQGGVPGSTTTPGATTPTPGVIH